MIRVALVLVCFVAGYWVVSRFLSGAPKREDAEPERVTMSNWYRILGVRESASAEEIKAAYRRAIGRVHPDKLAGASEADRARAEAEAKRLNAAYEMGLRLFEG
jgi:DnaJ-domain-containing protein 1